MLPVGQDYEYLRGKGMSGAAARTGKETNKNNKNIGKLESTEGCGIQGGVLLGAFSRIEITAGNN